MCDKVFICSHSDICGSEPTDDGKLAISLNSVLALTELRGTCALTSLTGRTAVGQSSSEASSSAVLLLLGDALPNS